MRSIEPSTARGSADLCVVPRVRVTHPFHPLTGGEFEFVKRRRNWQRDRVYFYDGGGELVALPAEGRMWLRRIRSWGCRWGVRFTSTVCLGCRSWCRGSRPGGRQRADLVSSEIRRKCQNDYAGRLRARSV